ncbi:MAG: WG repeat-containing protein [Sulfuricurvum sp.]
MLYPISHPTTLKDGFIDLNGTIVIPLIYDDVDDFGPSGLTKACVKEKCTVIDTQGNKVFDLPAGTTKLGKFVEHTAPIRVNGKMGFISDTGEMLEEMYDDVQLSNFKAGLAKVTMGSKYPTPYFISPDRKRGFGPFLYATEFDGDTASTAYGQAQVIKDAKHPETLIINTKGEIVGKKEYPYKKIKVYHSGYTIEMTDHKSCYYADANGTELIRGSIYDVCRPFDENGMGVVYTGKYGWRTFRTDGTVLIPKLTFSAQEASPNPLPKNRDNIPLLNATRSDDLFSPYLQELLDAGADPLSEFVSNDYLKEKRTVFEEAVQHNDDEKIFRKLFDHLKAKNALNDPRLIVAMYNLVGDNKRAVITMIDEGVIPLYTPTKSDQKLPDTLINDYAKSKGVAPELVKAIWSTMPLPDEEIEGVSFFMKGCRSLPLSTVQKIEKWESEPTRSLPITHKKYPSFDPFTFAMDWGNYEVALYLADKYGADLSKKHWFQQYSGKREYRSYLDTIAYSYPIDQPKYRAFFDRIIDSIDEETLRVESVPFFEKLTRFGSLPLLTYASSHPKLKKVSAEAIAHTADRMETECKSYEYADDISRKSLCEQEKSKLLFAFHDASRSVSYHLRAKKIFDEHSNVSLVQFAKNFVLYLGNRPIKVQRAWVKSDDGKQTLSIIGSALLLRAVHAGNRPLAEAILKAKVDPNAPAWGDTGGTFSRDWGAPYPLMAAAANHDTAMVEMLFSYGAKGNIIDEYRQSPLIYALEDATAKDLPLINRLIDRGSKLNGTFQNDRRYLSSDKFTPFVFAACYAKDFAVLQALVKLGADPKARMEDNASALYMMIDGLDDHFYSPQKLRYLLDLGLDPREKVRDKTLIDRIVILRRFFRSNGYSPKEAAEMLLAYGADPESTELKETFPKADDDWFEIFEAVGPKWDEQVNKSSVAKPQGGQ